MKLSVLRPSAVRHWKLMTTLIAGGMFLSVIALLVGETLLGLVATLISAFLALQWVMIDPPSVEEPSREQERTQRRLGGTSSRERFGTPGGARDVPRFEGSEATAARGSRRGERE